METFEKRCSYCNKLLQKFSKDLSYIESYEMFWYQMGDNLICPKCNEEKQLIFGVLKHD